MPKFENIERISIPRAFGFNALAKVFIISDDSVLRERVQNDIIANFNPDRYTTPFSFELLDRADTIPDKSVADVVRERNYLAIIQVLDSEEPTFIACRRSYDPVQDFMGIINLMYVSEQEFKDSFQDAIFDYSRTFPQKLKDLLHNIAGSFATAAFPGMFALPPLASRSISFEGRSEGKVKNPKIPKETIEEAKKDFVENVLKYQSGDVNALQKIEMVIKSMPESEKNKILSDYIKTMAEEGVNSLHKKYIDTNNILHTSKITVLVKRNKTCSGNDGYYRIYFKYGDNDIKQFVFVHKESCIIFLMHLLYNRQNGDIRKNLILDERNQHSFTHLFMKVYDVTESEAVLKYKNLQNEYDSDSNKMLAQGKLHNYISDCNKSVDSSILPLNESPYPLRITRNGYMPILNSNVYFDDDSLSELQIPIV